MERKAGCDWNGKVGKVNRIEIESANQKQHFMCIYIEGLHPRWTCQDCADEQHVLFLGAASLGRQGMGHVFTREKGRPW